MLSVVLQQNMTSKRMEYKGDLVDKLMALSDCGSGGQVIIDGPTLEQLADKTFSIARLVPPIDPHLPADASDPSRCVLSGCLLCHLFTTFIHALLSCWYTHSGWHALVCITMPIV